MRNKIITLLSGGLDSSTLAYWYSNEGYEQICLFVDYGHKTKEAELRAAKAICERLNLELVVVNVDEIGKLGKGLLVKTNHKSNLKTMSLDSFFPQRNLLLLVIAALVTENKDLQTIAMGIISSSGNYPDCSSQFIELATNVLKTSNNKLSILTPFIELNKQEVYKLATKLNVPIDITFSCDFAEDHHCMICPSCRERFED